MKACPICKNELQEGEQFRMEFYAPRNWWVFYHLREVNEKFTNETERDEFGYPETIETYRGWCARANVVISSPIPFQLRGTDWISF